MLLDNFRTTSLIVFAGLTLATGCAINTPESPTTTTESQVSTNSAPEPIVEENTTAAATTIRYFSDENGLAIHGTDPVAYFTESRPVAGKPEFTHTWSGSTWRFATAENRDRFAANPEQYAPQYGGFCAWAVSQGYTASIDPNAWKIVDGKLYLNFSPGVQRRWERNIPNNIQKADANWPDLATTTGET
ncbi:MAG: YHS domain-containing (seleno)protein [Cyanobacteria bacterium P01_H01_bin.15]